MVSVTQIKALNLRKVIFFFVMDKCMFLKLKYHLKFYLKLTLKKKKRKRSSEMYKELITLIVTKTTTYAHFCKTCIKRPAKAAKSLFGGQRGLLVKLHTTVKITNQMLMLESRCFPDFTGKLF